MSEAQAIIRCVCNEHKNSDLRADNKDILAALDERLRELHLEIADLKAENHKLRNHIEFCYRVSSHAHIRACICNGRGGCVWCLHREALAGKEQSNG